MSAKRTRPCVPPDPWDFVAQDQMICEEIHREQIDFYAAKSGAAAGDSTSVVEEGDVAMCNKKG